MTNATKFDTMDQAQAEVDARRGNDWSFEACRDGEQFVVECYDDFGAYKGLLGEVCA